MIPRPSSSESSKLSSLAHFRNDDCVEHGLMYHPEWYETHVNITFLELYVSELNLVT